jgi:hypothetical protein
MERITARSLGIGLVTGLIAAAVLAFPVAATTHTRVGFSFPT